MAKAVARVRISPPPPIQGTTIGSFFELINEKQIELSRNLLKQTARVDASEAKKESNTAIISLLIYVFAG